KCDALVRARVKSGPLANRREKDERFDPGRGPRCAPHNRLLPPEDRGKTLRLPVSEWQWVVRGDAMSLRRPGPAVGIAPKGARPRLHLDENQTDGRENEDINFVYTPVIVDEFEVRPCAPRIMVRQVLAKKVQRFPFPFECRLAYCGPAPCFHGSDRGPKAVLK